MIHSTTGILNNHVIGTRCVESLACGCNKKPAAPQGYYHRQSNLNIHQALTHTQTDHHIQQCSYDQRELSPCRAAELFWNNQSVGALRVRFSFCPSQHTMSFGWQHINKGTFDYFPLTKCWFESLFGERESPLIALTISEKVCDVSVVPLDSWRCLHDNQPLKVSGRIVPEDVPFDMRW